MTYERKNDNELLYMILQQDEMAWRYLIHAYQKEIWVVVKRFSRKNYRYLGHDDFYQAALVKLSEAVLDYKPGSTCSFHYFYFNALQRMMIDLLRSLNTCSEKMSFQALSLDTRIEDCKGSYRLLDVIAQERFPDQRESKSLYHEIAIVQFQLNELEQAILRLRGLGYTYQQVASELQISKKKVDNTLAKVRKRKKNPYG